MQVGQTSTQETGNTEGRVPQINNIVQIAPDVMRKMRAWSEQEVAKHSDPLYGHNDPEPTMRGVMGEYAVRELYRHGGIQAKQNLAKFDPDLTIPKHMTLQGEQPARCEEVKSWADGYIYDKWGNTVRPSQANRYHAKGRARVWFCSCDVSTGIVVVHGWATTQEIIDAPIIETDGRFGAPNHYIEVLHRVHEVLPYVDTVDDNGGWF